MMQRKMVVLSDIQTQSLPRQFLIFSEAYIDTATRQCEYLARSQAEYNFAHGAAILYLTHHGLELFLKGAILENNGELNFREKGHDLPHLYKKYRELCSGKEYELAIPWSLEDSDYESFYDPVEAAKLRALKQKRPEDQVLRYPTDKKTKAWNLLYGFKPILFLHEISVIREELERIKRILFPS